MSMTTPSLHPKRFGLIGCGRIGAPVVQAWRAGTLPGWELAGVLQRQPRDPGGGVAGTADAQVFFAQPLDLVVETAGPAALAEHGERALACADVWSVSAAALADAQLHARLEAAGRASGHRLRLVSGAIAGLDGVAMAAAADPQAELRLELDLPPGPGERRVVFEGTVREAAARYPGSVNVAAAAALAGPGLDAARIVLSHPGPVPRHRLALVAEGRAGRVEAATEPQLGAGVHPVAACLVAMLRRELQTVWAG